MRRFATFMVAIVLAGAAPPVMAQPAIEVVGGTKFDFGNLYKGDVVNRDLTIKNRGSDTLVVQDVVPSCGCTGTVVSNKEIPPGKTGTVKITFNSKNFTGTVHKTVTVRSNASNAPSLTIEFTATIKQEIVITPLQFWFKDAQVGRLDTLSVTIRNEGAVALDLTGVRTQLEGLVVTLPKRKIDPGGEARITAAFTPPKTAPVLAEAVFITTSNPRQPELYIPVFGNVKEFKFE